MLNSLQQETPSSITLVIPWRKKFAGLQSITRNGFLDTAEYYRLAAISWEIRYRFESPDDSEPLLTADDFIKSSVYDAIYSNGIYQQRIRQIAHELGQSEETTARMMVSLTCGKIAQLLVELSPSFGRILPHTFDSTPTYVIEAAKAVPTGLYLTMVNYPCRI